MNAHSPSLSRLVFLAARLAIARARGKLDGEEPQPAPLAEGSQDETPSVPEDETPPVPQAETPSVPQDEAPPIPQAESPSVPQDEAPPIPQAETPSVPQDEAPPISQAETPSVPQDEAPPDAPVETPSAPSVDVETAPPQSDFAAYARFASPLRTNPYADFDDAEREIYLKAHLNLCASVEAIVSLIRAVRYIVENKIPGAFIECGVFMGGNIEVMIRTLQTFGITDRDIFLYDTFAGMPRPDATDDVGLDNELRRIWDIHRTDADGDAGSDWMRAGIDVVRQRVRTPRLPAGAASFRQGHGRGHDPHRYAAGDRAAATRHGFLFFDEARTGPSLPAAGLRWSAHHRRLWRYAWLPARCGRIYSRASAALVPPASMRMCGLW